MEDKIIQIAENIFDDKISMYSKIGNPQNWDSLGQLNLMMAIEKELGIKFNPDEVIESDTIEKIVNVVKSKI